MILDLRVKNYKIGNPVSWKEKAAKSFKKYKWLYLFLIPAVLWELIFIYAPIGEGFIIAFKRYTGAKSIMASKWVGFKHFITFFKSYYAWPTIKNTFLLQLYNLLTFPIPIIIALLINEVGKSKLNKSIQTVMYAPHFISLVVLVSMMNLLFSPNYGFVNQLIEHFGGTARNFMMESSAFRSLYVWSEVWQNTGWNLIIYVAALSGVDPALHEAAVVDGCTRLQRILHVNLPTIMPTIIITLILKLGRMMEVGADKVLLMKNDLNSATAEVLSTFTYSRGLINGDFSYATAVGLLTNVVNFLLIVAINRTARKISDTSLF